MLTKIFKAIKHPRVALIILLNKTSSIFPDKFYLKIRYWLRMKERLNIKNPQTFNEKLQWLKLYDRNPKYTQMVDKYEVKEYVAKIIGEQYIIPTIAVYDSVDEIDFDKLPDQFVLKCTHDSGGIIICKDKAQLNIHEAKKKLSKFLKRRYFYQSREWPYKNVEPRIIAEKYMVDESGYELKDYKIFNFKGVPKLIQIDFDRFTEHKRNLYTTSWKFIDARIQYPNDVNHQIEKPKEFESMLNFASLLSMHIPHLRTDFYLINNQIFFGELTFYSESGMAHFIPDSLNYELGQMIELPLM